MIKECFMTHVLAIYLLSISYEQNLTKTLYNCIIRLDNTYK